jgi:N-acetylglucosaminyl-diphospho-decaprenol L-rhamnosyltransferase
LIPTESKEVAPPDGEGAAQIARPRVRAIVVSWNGEKLLPSCLRALELQRGDFSLSPVVVDNGSTDGSLELLKREFPNLERIELAENLGYGRANNVALARALSAGDDFALLVNNDVELDPDYLARLIDAARANKTAALLTGTLLFRERLDDKDQVNSTGLVIDWFGRARDRDFRISLDQLRREDGPVAGVSGGAALLRCSALARIGLFDPDYFAYYEDVDLSLRARAAGHACWYVKSAIARHRFGATFGPGSPTQRYLLGRNHLRTAGRHLPTLRAAAVITGTAVYRLAVKSPLELLRGEPALARAEVRAAADGIVAAIKAWRHR